jgi:hypothetical protein
MTNTKSGPGARTYAQNLCYAAATPTASPLPRYQSHSAAKLLIYIETSNCFFSGHFKKSLDLQGLAQIPGKLSTKLSTENLEICKAVINQGLSALTGSAFEDVLASACPA